MQSPWGPQGVPPAHSSTSAEERTVRPGSCREAVAPAPAPAPTCLHAHQGTGSQSGWHGIRWGKGSDTRQARSRSAQSHKVGGFVGIRPHLGHRGRETAVHKLAQFGDGHCLVPNDVAGSGKGSTLRSWSEALLPFFIPAIHHPELELSPRMNFWHQPWRKRKPWRGRSCAPLPHRPPVPAQAPEILLLTHTLLSQGAGLVTYWAGAPVSSRHILTPAGLADGRALPALIHVWKRTAQPWPPPQHAPELLATPRGEFRHFLYAQGHSFHYYRPAV